MSDDDDFCRVWVGNLSNKVDSELLYELFLQAGPLEDVSIPKDYGGRQGSYGYGFVTFKHPSSVWYAVDLFEKTELFGKELKIRPKQRQMLQQNNETYSLSSLRGFGLDPGMTGRDAISNSFGRNSNLMPKGIVNSRKMNERPLRNLPMHVSNSFGGNSDLMPREIVNPGKTNEGQFPNVPDFNTLLQMEKLLQNPYSSMMGGSMEFNPPGCSPYSSQLNPVANKKEENSRRNHQNNYHSHNRHDRDYEKSHPYRDGRHDDRRHGHSSSSRYQSSGSYRRERR